MSPDDHELVAADAEDRVVRSLQGEHPPRQSGQDTVADRVAQGVVDQLEPVEFDHRNLENRARGLGLYDSLGQFFVQAGSIEQTGQTVLIGQTTNATLSFLVSDRHPGDPIDHCNDSILVLGRKSRLGR